MNLKPILKAAIDAIVRHGSTILIGVLALLLIGSALAELKTVLFVTALIMLVTTISGFTLFAYTKFNFSAKVIFGSDLEFSDAEKKTFLTFAGMIYIANAILAGLCVIGYYLAQIPAMNP